ncbi:hypothetical protein PVL29_012071 [Vitis rotundifolia]|uniref:Uncharacterized protein n=1 Tax=Vitis rotundifolia TaxID=103349 RepID=A0AA38ZQM8_VITRO|nr:hypothetical protein PVL29_012071 [Vitis rotundifolia]
MEFLSSILGLLPCLYDHTSKHTVYIRDLKTNLQALSKVMVDLNNLYEDVKERVEGAEQRQMRRRKEVGGWICEVEDMVKEVKEILRKGDQEIQKRCLRCCPRNCWSSYKIGKAVSETLVAVSGQIGRGHFDVVAEMLPPPLVDELPMEETVGSEFTYDRICRFLNDPQVGIVGLYGMEGVGKTTLLKKINNDFLTTSSHFDVAIWVVVSKPSNIENIQEVIWNKLQIPRGIWEIRSTKEEKAAEILRVLKTKKFVLLLDDIWERLNLLDMGVPHPNAQMKAQKSTEVACLSSEAAWTLFQKEVGEETLKSHPHVPRLARIVVEECKGLPLALITLGRAMAGEKDPSNWDKVIQDLSKFPAEISGMEDELFHRLKVSYDRLSDNVIKSCFTYCSLFLEDWEISNENLIRYWIGEGFLGEVHDIHEARNQGHKIIKKLKHACLLESGGSKEQRVKMHDVIHDMALWLYCECGEEKNKILVYNDVSRLKEAQEILELKETEKMSLWDENVEEFPKTLVCPNLKTLIVACDKLKKFPSGFFQFMPVIRVLDLSNNDNLSELPTGISKLGALRYLNLSSTKIRDYDRLSDNVIKSCFTYCSLFSEDWEISNENLIEYWIGEGFLGEVHDIHEVRNQGYKIIKKLKHACLLESCGSREKRVKMHDVIHDMALWLDGECGKKKNKILVYNDVSRLKEAQEIPNLKVVEKLSLWDENVEKFPKTLVCPNLKTLIVKGCNELTKFSSGFFQFVPLIRVLDLSDNDNLTKLPIGISKLGALRYLNLSSTKIRELPIELSNLKNLMTLLLEDMESLELIIPQELISSLISLKLFCIHNTNVLSEVEESLLDELESLNGISEIRITIFTTLSFNKLNGSHKLQRCISHLQFDKCGDVISLELSSSFLKRMEHLQRLCISNCDELKDIEIKVEGEGTQRDATLRNYIAARGNYFRALHEVYIDNCSKLLNITWLVCAPYLEELTIEDCESIEQVICYGVEEKLDIFSRLKYLKLNNLPRLKSINHHPLPFSSLEIIKVYDCKSLRSLPFDSNTSNNNLKKIKGETSWWNQLEWNDETIKHSFTPYFQIHEAEAYLTDSEESETDGIDDMQEDSTSN